MILQLLEILLISLGFDNKPKNYNSLRPQPQYTILNLRNPILVIVVSGLIIIFITAGLILFTMCTGVSMVESGTVYNHPWI